MVACKQLLITYIAATLLQQGYGDNPLSGVIIMLVTLISLPLELATSIADRGLKKELTLYELIKRHETKDQANFLIAWAGYQQHAKESSTPDAEEQMLQALEELQNAPPSFFNPNALAQTPGLVNTIEELWALAVGCNAAMHAVLEDVVKKAGGGYTEGNVVGQWEGVVEGTGARYARCANARNSPAHARPTTLVLTAPPLARSRQEHRAHARKMQLRLQRGPHPTCGCGQSFSCLPLDQTLHPRSARDQARRSNRGPSCQGPRH